jgi:hypothetical protein
MARNNVRHNQEGYMGQYPLTSHQRGVATEELEVNRD